jgi:K+-transporting ATPase ATPase C chain
MTMNSLVFRGFGTQLRSAAMLTLVLTVLTGLVYPLVLTGIAQVLFHRQANGSLIVQRGQVVGSELIGQNFSSDKYFQPRPSAAGESGYDATASGGSNLGPTNKKLLDQMQERADAYRTANGLGPSDPVPADAVTASASGLDPHISPANAALQVARVARARGISEEQIRDLVARYTDGPQWGIFGEPRVNVLKLNLALDAASGAR